MGSEIDLEVLKAILSNLEEQLRSLDDISSRARKYSPKLHFAGAQLTEVISQIRDVHLSADLEVFQGSDPKNNRPEA